MVFLVLAAQYESYIDPFIILLTVPLVIMGALIAVRFMHFIDPPMANDVYKPCTHNLGRYNHVPTNLAIPIILPF
jgi:hypothetical protein